MKRGWIAGLTIALACFGCDKKDKSPEGETTSSTANAAKTTNNTGGAAARSTAAATSTATTAQPDPSAMEEDPNATDKVEPYDFEGKKPEGFAAPGETLKVLGWRDKYGLNAVVFSRQERKSKGESKSQGLIITHARQEGDASWTEVRTFRELVNNCDFDITLEPKTGDWSITDLDKDSVGEFTFAYSAGCRSDVSPVEHKVLMSEDGSKYALRGQTKVEGEGGKFKADFKGAPDGFQKHAGGVWAKTVEEKM